MGNKHLYRARNCIKQTTYQTKSLYQSTVHICQVESVIFQADQPEPVEKMVQRPTPRKNAEEKVLYDFLSSIAFECSCSAILVTSPSASLHATTLYLHVLSYHLCNQDDTRQSLSQADTQPMGNHRHCRYQQMLHGCCVRSFEYVCMQTMCAERQKLWRLVSNGLQVLHLARQYPSLTG